MVLWHLGFWVVQMRSQLRKQPKLRIRLSQTYASVIGSFTSKLNTYHELLLRHVKAAWKRLQLDDHTTQVWASCVTAPVHLGFRAWGVGPPS